METERWKEEIHQETCGRNSQKSFCCKILRNSGFSLLYLNLQIVLCAEKAAAGQQGARLIPLTIAVWFRLKYLKKKKKVTGEEIVLSLETSMCKQSGDLFAVEDKACRAEVHPQLTWGVGDSCEKQRAQLCREHILRPAAARKGLCYRATNEPGSISIPELSILEEICLVRTQGPRDRPLFQHSFCPPQKI